MRSTFLALSLAALSLSLSAAAGPAGAQSHAVTVEIDHASRVQLRGAASSVIVGNPAIADVTVVDASTLFITGKGYGSTEVVVVDGIGRTLFNANVVVVAPTAGQVRLWRGGGGAVQELACAASCSPTVRSAAPAAASDSP